MLFGTKSLAASSIFAGSQVNKKKAVVIYVCGGDHHRWPRVVSKVGVGGGAAANQMSFSLHSDL